MSRAAQPNLLRYLPGDTPVHRMWAGTKLVCLGALSLALGLRPQWSGIAVFTVVLILAFLVARVPFSALPRLPWWFWAGLGVSGAIATFAGGPPEVQVGSVTLELGGFLPWLRITVLTIELFLAANLIGWTTEMGDIGPALAYLLNPLRVVRVPVDDLVGVTMLAVRAFPLLLDEIRTLQAAWRLRRPPITGGPGEAIAAVHDLLVTAIVSAARRAGEMATAMEARGGLRAVEHRRPRWSLADTAAVAVTTTGCAGVFLL